MKPWQLLQTSYFRRGGPSETLAFHYSRQILTPRAFSAASRGIGVTQDFRMFNALRIGVRAL